MLQGNASLWPQGTAKKHPLCFLCQVLDVMEKMETKRVVCFYKWEFKKATDFAWIYSTLN